MTVVTFSLLFCEDHYGRHMYDVAEQTEAIKIMPQILQKAQQGNYVKHSRPPERANHNKIFFLGIKRLDSEVMGRIIKELAPFFY
jgi:NADH:ubiquinone oxidoreductase subunit D